MGTPRDIRFLKRVKPGSAADGGASQRHGRPTWRASRTARCLGRQAPRTAAAPFLAGRFRAIPKRRNRVRTI